MDKEMRRNEKAIPKEECLEALAAAEYGVLSTVSTDETPYGVPMNFAYADGAIYFHCALQGHRLENLEKNKNGCLTVVDSVQLMPEKFSTKFRSVIVFGLVSIAEDKEEKLKGIRAIAQKFSPQYPKEGEEYIASAFDKMHVLKMDIEKMTGKATR